MSVICTDCGVTVTETTGLGVCAVCIKEYDEPQDIYGCRHCRCNSRLNDYGLCLICAARDAQFYRELDKELTTKEN